MSTDATFWPAKANPPPRPDLRDQRGRETPDRWQPQGRPRTENEAPAGGRVPSSTYHDKGRFSPDADTRPLPTK